MIFLSVVVFLLSTFNFIPSVKMFFLGSFGVMLYPVLLFTLLFGVGLAKNLKFVYSKKYILYLLLAFFFFVCILHVCFTGFSELGTYGGYLNACYKSMFTPGGVVAGVFVYPFVKLLNAVAGLVVFGIGLIISIYLIVVYLDSARETAKLESRNYTVFNEFLDEEKIDDVKPVPPLAKQIATVETESIFIPDEKPDVDLAKEKLGLKPKEELENLGEEETASQKLFNAKTEGTWQNRGIEKPQKFTYEKEVQPKKQNPLYEREREYLATIYDKNNVNDNPIINAEDYEDYKAKMKLYTDKNSKPFVRESLQNEVKQVEPDEELGNDFGIEPENNSVNIDVPFVDDENSLDESEIKPIEPQISPLNPKNFEVETNYDEEKAERFLEEREVETGSIAEELGKTHEIGNNQHTFNFDVINGTSQKKEETKPDFEYNSNYNRPPLDLLFTYENDEDLETDHQKNIEALETVLEEFKIPAKVENVMRGAAVTRYELHMPTGIPVRKIQAHASDIALALAAKSEIRIEAPIKGKSAVGIEVPNNKIDTVGLKDIIASNEFTNAKAPLTFALGKDVDGSVYCCNLNKMPHLLVAGSTGSGKSVCLNALILSLLYRTSPEDLRIILVDPKRVEFGIYNDLPHLLMPKVITEPKKALNAFDWLINEMERRFLVFQKCFVKNLAEYNNQPDVVNKKLPKLPYIVLIVDELADLVVTTNKKELEEKIIRLTQKARAAGIHLILATQRPSVDIITGSIKINLPSRIAFAVSSYVDSKTILDQAGAEKLLGKGDMLYSPSDSEPVRVQGAFVDTPEVRAVVEYIKENNPVSYDDNIGSTINAENNGGGGGEMGFGNQPSVDNLMQDALKLAIDNGQISISMLQRRFAIGYQRAAKIIDQMEQGGFISSSDGSKPRVVYITLEDYNILYKN